MKNILYCGFGKLGTDCIKRLISEGYNVIYILTHKELHDESVDTFAINNNIDYSYKDTRKYMEYFLSLLQEKRIDYLVSINYRYIIPKEIFGIFKYAINIHGSLLPKYRGRTPHVWSIINGEEYSGITCHLIDEGVDTGNIITQIKVKIDSDDTGYTLLQKFQRLYPDILINSLKKLKHKEKIIEQNETIASYYGKRTPDMGYIDFYKNKQQIINFVRAQAYPYPGAYYYLNWGKKIIINKIVSENTNIAFCEYIGVIKRVGNDYYVRCLDGVLKLADYDIVD